MAPEVILTSENGLADLLGVPPRWIRAEADAGRLPMLRVGRRRMFDPAAVRAVLDERARLEAAAREREGGGR